MIWNFLVTLIQLETTCFLAGALLLTYILVVINYSSKILFLIYCYQISYTQAISELFITWLKNVYIRLLFLAYFSKYVNVMSNCAFIFKNIWYPSQFRFICWSDKHCLQLFIQVIDKNIEAYWAYNQTLWHITSLLWVLFECEFPIILDSCRHANQPTGFNYFTNQNIYMFAKINRCDL